MPSNADEISALQQLYFLFVEQEILLQHIRNYTERSRYRVSVKNIGLEEALQTIRLHKQKLAKLPNLSQAQGRKAPGFSNIKTTIYNCCNNQAEIIRLLLWLTLLKNVFAESENFTEMAHQETQVLQTVFKLF